MAERRSSSVSTKTAFLLLAGVTFCLAAVNIWPEIDLAVSGLFYQPGYGFPLDYNPTFQAVHWAATNGAWGLAAILFLAAVMASVRRKPFLKITGKGWLFLFLALILAPGLLANIVLKDHWGRARPAQVTEFGGTKAFSPALVPQAEAHKNGSFVAGDAAFGFFLPCFGYVLTGRSSRRVFWGGMGAGVLLSALRISMGAHFLSDTIFAAALMLLVTAVLHAAMFGRAATARYWRNWLFGEAK